MTSAPLNKSIFSSWCSYVSSGELCLLSFPCINSEPHPMSPYCFLLHQLVLFSAQISANDLQKSFYESATCKFSQKKIGNCIVLPAVQQSMKADVNCFIAKYRVSLLLLGHVRFSVAPCPITSDQFKKLTQKTPTLT